MDATAFALARENRMPIIVFSIREPGAIEAVMRGRDRSRDYIVGMAAFAAGARGSQCRSMRESREATWQQTTHTSQRTQATHAGRASRAETGAGGLRTGRASANLLDPVQVDAYGTHMPLNQVATVSVPEPRLLSVQVWDRRWSTRWKRRSWPPISG